MKKSNTLIIIIIAAIVIVGGYALLHKSNKTTPSKSATTSTPAVNNAVLLTKTDSALGQYLADSSGKPLYTYNADSSGKSNCSGSCLANWPAYEATASSNLPSGVGTITRSDDGKMQYTYNGMPLYYFVSDSADNKPGGNGVDNFALAKPASPSGSSSSSTNSSTTNNASNSNPYNY